MSTRIVTITNDCAAMAKDPNCRVVRKSYWWGLQKQVDFDPKCDGRKLILETRNKAPDCCHSFR